MPSGVCRTHCPDPRGSPLVLAAVVVAVAAVVAVVVNWVVSELPLLVLGAVAFTVPLLGWCVWMGVHYRGTPPWERQAVERPALPAPERLAIEPATINRDFLSQVVPGVVLESRLEQRR